MSWLRRCGVVIALSLLASGCAVTVQDDWFLCESDMQCPSGWSCVADHCRRPGDGGGRADGGVRTCTAEAECNDNVACTIDMCAAGQCENAAMDEQCSAIPGGVCDAVLGCQPGTCTTDTCLPDAPCQSASCEGNVCVRTSLCEAGASCCEGVCFDGACSEIDPCEGMPSGHLCRESAGLCDIEETCDGVSPSCPPDEFQAMGLTCRAASGNVCDVSEECTGTNGLCPTDRFAIAGVSCTDGTCNGLGVCVDGCLEGTPCSNGNPCELGIMRCTGGPPRCEADGAASTDTVCRDATGLCDVEETCDGTTTVCPADEVHSSGDTCRGTAGPCDRVELCDGASKVCPTDVLEGNGTPCRGVAGDCDSAEVCTGSSAACPADVFASGLCRGAVGGCDVSEYCSGSSAFCPGDIWRNSGDRCGVCDAAEDYCSGVSPYCTGTIAECCPNTTGIELCSGSLCGLNPDRYSRCRYRTCSPSGDWGAYGSCGCHTECMLF